MAAAGRMEDAGMTTAHLPDGAARLWEDLEERGPQFRFFQAVRLLQTLSDGRRAVGMFGDPNVEVVHFNASDDLGFPASEIQALERGRGGPHAMTVNFMGLTGPQGVLPLYYSALVRRRTQENDRALKAFLDIFHNRMIALFYRAWERGHFYVEFERTREDRLTAHMHDLVGLGGEKLRNRLPIPDESLLLYVGLLSRHQRSAAALEQLLEDFFRVPVEVEQFVGGWHDVRPDEQGRVGDTGLGAPGQLGIGTVVGDELWDPQSRVRIRLGPLARDQFESFLPSGDAHAKLKALARYFGDDQFDFDVQLILDKQDVPPVVLGTDDDTSPPLGWGTWILSKPYVGAADETIFSL